MILSDNELLNDIRKLAEVERTNLVNFLHHLREIDRRRLYSELKHQSLFDFVVKDLRYSEPAALRRISAMRLMAEFPEVEAKIVSGAITLTTLALARFAFSKAKRSGITISNETKKRIIRALENQSVRETKKVLETLNLKEAWKKPIRYEDIANEILRERLLELKGRFAHISPNIPLEELMMRICDGLLGPRRWDQNAPSPEKVHSGTEDKRENLSVAAAKREVWRRDQSRCSNCESTYAVQIDHIIPIAAGGSSTIENMRLLCRSCNQRAAINYFGMKKMDGYIGKDHRGH